MSLVALMKLSVNLKYQFPQERTLSHYIQSILDGNHKKGQCHIIFRASAMETWKQKVFWGAQVQVAPLVPPLLSRACLSFVLFLDTHVSLEPTHVIYNLAEPNITLLNRSHFHSLSVSTGPPLDRSDVSLPSHCWTNGWLTEKPSKNHWSQWLSKYHSINGNGHLRNHWFVAMVVHCLPFYLAEADIKQTNDN